MPVFLGHIFKEAEPLAAFLNQSWDKVSFSHTFPVFTCIKWELEHDGVST